MSKIPDEIEFENARLAHATANKSMEVETNIVPAFGNAAMRAPGIAAAGGIAAILGFYSANASVLRGTVALDDFNAALLWFFGSVLACVIAPGAAYFSQALFVQCRSERTHHFDRPFVRDTSKSTWLFRVGTVFQIAAILLTAAAIAALVCGGLAFMRVAVFAGSPS